MIKQIEALIWSTTMANNVSTKEWITLYQFLFMTFLDFCKNSLFLIYEGHEWNLIDVLAMYCCIFCCHFLSLPNLLILNCARPVLFCRRAQIFDGKLNSGKISCSNPVVPLQKYCHQYCLNQYTDYVLA